MAKGKQKEAWLDGVLGAGSDEARSVGNSKVASPKAPKKSAGQTSKKPAALQTNSEAVARFREKTVRLEVNVDPDFARQVRIKCAVDGVTLSDVLRRALNLWLSDELKLE